MRPLDLTYNLLALRPANLKKYEMKSEIKRKYEIMNVKLGVNS